MQEHIEEGEAAESAGDIGVLAESLSDVMSSIGGYDTCTNLDFSPIGNAHMRAQVEGEVKGLVAWVNKISGTQL